MTGVEMIAQERERQISAEGYSAQHAHTDGSLALAAACYCVPAPIYTIEFCGDGDTHEVWPWDADEEEKIYACDEIRRLTIAGALIAAEIDRLIRARELSI